MLLALKKCLFHSLRHGYLFANYLNMICSVGKLSGFKEFSRLDRISVKQCLQGLMGNQEPNTCPTEYREHLEEIQSTLDNSNLARKSKKVRVIVSLK